MMKIKKYISLSIISSLLLFGCEVNDFDLQDNPNLLTPDSANPEFLLNELQYLFQDIMGDMTLNTDDIMRYEAMTDTYSDVVEANVLNTEWERFYEALIVSRTINAQATDNDNLLFHNAINKLLMGYLTITMVDYVGNIPFSQATNPGEFSDPELDSGVELYKMVLEDIDQAKFDIEAATFDVSSDLFYNSNKDNWIAFANSFKLRLLIQTRMASGDLNISDLEGEINALINSDIIDTESEDFVYTFAAVEEPESRHPYFTRAYINGFSQYIGNYFMFMLKDSKSISDPRIRYYLYRQSDLDPFSGPPYLACGQDDPMIGFCYVGDQYWGLDHGEGRTGRGDNLFRTAYGIYPGGGAFDEDQFDGTPDTSNLGGAGFLPILTSSNMKFLMAESALMLGTTGDPVVLLEEAVRASMTKVLGFGGVSSTFEATNSDVDDYVAEVINNYNAASDNAAKLDVIITEYYLATYGNSIEAYNAYRRTGFPSNIQIPIDNAMPTFPRTFRYAEDAVNLNTSISQKPITDKVFWDKNPDGFIN
ncbi:SusD/RagB family nutrient-binding outer membrane lipoprotein [Psychroserpens sp. MEBiC05023]